MLPAQLQGGDSCTRDSARLEEILERDVAAGGVVLGQRGRINIKHYAAAVGCSVFVFEKRGLKQVTDRYEVEVSASSNLETRLPEMRNWLERGIEDGSLGTRNGKVDRTEFSRVFAIKGGSFITGSRRIREMFDEFDFLVASGQYFPKNVRDELARVESVLALNCPIHKGGLTVCKTRLALATDLSEYRLSREPFITIISRKEEEVRNEALSSRVYPLLEGQRYDFQGLVQILGNRFCEQIGVGFVEYASTLSQPTRRPRYLILLNVLNFIGSSITPDCVAVVKSATQGELISQKHWENALWEWRNNLVDNGGASLKESSITQHIDAARQVFDAFFSRKIVPDLRNPIIGKKNSAKKGGKRKTVAEAVKVVGVAPRSNDSARYVDFAQGQLLGATKKFSVDITTEESSTFLAVLAAELQRDEDLSADPAQAILTVINRRLDVVQRVAEEKYRYWRCHYDKGEDIARRANIAPDDFFAGYRSLNNYDKGIVLSPYFPNASEELTEERRSLGIANMIAIAIIKYNGLMPDQRSADKAEGLGQFFERRYDIIGNKVELDAYLNPHPDAIGAALTLYLLASGANAAVGRTLVVDCTEPSDLPGHTRITGFKARAKGKPIIADLPSNSLAVEAVEWIASSARFARAAVNLSAKTKEELDPLFVARIKGEYKLIEPAWYTGWFKRHIASTDELSGLGIVPSMIRSSILLRVALENDGRLQAGAAIRQVRPQFVTTRRTSRPLAAGILFSQHPQMMSNSGQHSAVSSAGPPSSIRPGVCATSDAMRVTAWRLSMSDHGDLAFRSLDDRFNVVISNSALQAMIDECAQAGRKEAAGTMASVGDSDAHW